MKRSESISNLTAKMQVVKLAVGVVQFDSTNPFFNSKYFSLAALYSALNPMLAEVGLVVIQTAENNEIGWPGIHTILMDQESGEYIETAQYSPYPQPGTNKEGREVPINPLHVTGQADTYLRRYTLVTLFGLIGDADADGNLGDGQEHNPKVGMTVTRSTYVKPSSTTSAATPAKAAQPVTPSSPTSSSQAFSEEEPFGLTVRALVEELGYTKPSSEAQSKFVNSVFQDLIADDQVRHLVKEDVLGSADAVNLSPMVSAFLNWLKPEMIETGELNKAGKPKKIMKLDPEKKQLILDSAKWHEQFTFGNAEGEY